MYVPKASKRKVRSIRKQMERKRETDKHIHEIEVGGGQESTGKTHASSSP